MESFGSSCASDISGSTGEAVLLMLGSGESARLSASEVPQEVPLCANQLSDSEERDLSAEHRPKANQQEAPRSENSRPQNLRSDPWRKALWFLLAAVFLFQAYYVREMLAALVIFTILFVICAVIAGVIYLLGRAGETTVAMAEPVARRGVAYAEELRQKAFRRPHSAPAP
jgi:hypothetical protein